jgi:hypothetical protein
MFDVVHIAMRRAVNKFGGDDKVFNGAGFGTELAKLANLASGVDGNLVEVILCGRDDVEQLSGGSHYRLVEKKPQTMAFVSTN